MSTPGNSHGTVTPQTVNRDGIDQLPSGAWRARVTVNGKQVSIGTYPNLTAAGRARTLAQAEIAKGTWIDPKRAAITLDDWMVLWMPKRGVRPLTLEKDWARYRNHIKPHLGNLPLHRITPYQVATWLGALQANPATIKKAHTLLSTCLGVKGAMGDQRIGSNPCRIVRPGTVEKPRWNLLTQPQFEQLLTKIPDRYKPLVVVAAFTGLRWSELAALTRADYNPLRKTLSVTKGATGAGHRRRLGDTKNRRSRTVPCTPRVTAALNQLTADLEPDQLIFTSPTGGPLSDTNFAARAWRPARTKAGLPHVRFHDLRHSCASWLLAAGATPAQVRDMLGHASITTTELYLHTQPETLADVVTAAFG